MRKTKFQLQNRSDKKKKASEPTTPVLPPRLCKNCKRENLGIIRSFQKASCEHHDEDTHSEEEEEQKVEEKPEEQLDEVEQEVEEPIPEKNQEESSSSGDEEMRNHLTSKINRIRNNRAKNGAGLQ